MFWLNLGRRFLALDLVPGAAPEDLRGTVGLLRKQLEDPRQ